MPSRGGPPWGEMASAKKKKTPSSILYPGVRENRAPLGHTTTSRGPGLKRKDTTVSIHGFSRGVGLEGVDIETVPKGNWEKKDNNRSQCWEKKRGSSIRS